MSDNPHTFYWHDYETWGLNPALDRPSQFAGIRTDNELNIVGEAEMFYCRLPDDYLPTIEPALITGITPEITQSKGLYEFEFAKRINQLFSQANTCTVGYNTIRFDEEFSRNLFYRNFYDPYEYTWKNGNSRWDIIDLVRAAYALRPDGITWPKNEHGLPSFRLEELTIANQISHEQAHDAMSDVYATIAVAKLIKQKIPRLFDYYLELRKKNNVKALIDCESMTPIAHVSGMFGAVRSNISMVSPIVWHPINTNAVAVIDLTQDISPVLELSPEIIHQRLYTKKDELDGELPIPLKLIHINKCPFIAISKVITSEVAQRLAIDIDYCENNHKLLKNNLSVKNKISQVLSYESSFEMTDNVDAKLYQGFFSDDDKKIFKQIRASHPKQLSTTFYSANDERFKQLFFNYRARNFSEGLNPEESEQWVQQCVNNHKDGYSDYLNELFKLREKSIENEQHLKIIDSLEKHAKSISKKFNFAGQ